MSAVSYVSLRIRRGVLEGQNRGATAALESHLSVTCARFVHALGLHAPRPRSSLPPTTMSHPFFWPGRYFFYPIGNTSAVSLTRHLPPQERANLLLLGCGDPRHVLYTIFSELDHCELPHNFDPIVHR